MRSTGSSYSIRKNTHRHIVKFRKPLLAIIGLSAVVFIITGRAQVPQATNAPRFFNYPAPNGLGDDAGEPSIGVNWKTGSVNYYGGFLSYMLTVNFDDNVSPARTTWANKNLFLAATPRALGDPILFTDRETGRTFVSQLEGGTKQNTMDYTDDDGESFQQSVGSGINSGVDHQTLGGGPFAAPLAGSDPLSPHALQYCAQDVADANCALSLDGGRTFGPAIPIWTRNQCRGIHGHVKVAPDGTVYVPVNGCGGTDLVDHNDGEQAVSVSENNGVTWEVRQVKGSHPGSWDPSVSTASDGTIYFGYMNDEHDVNGNFTGSTPHISVSHDKGKTWTNDTNVGTQLGIQNIAFPAVVAGDPQRAAFAFHGSTTGGNYDDAAFSGVWHLYIASTYDGGLTWNTVDTTPNDPVQRGSICTNGTLCSSNTGGDTRNLLDFFDATVDKQGRVLVGYADGCVTQECISGVKADGTAAPNDYAKKATIARQSGGKGLFATYDAQFARITPAAPQLIASTNGQSTNLAWSTPDDGGSPITSYNIYRAIGPGPNTLIASVSADLNSYTDNSSSSNNSYSVQAVNANGAGALSPGVKATPMETPCVMPGLTAAADLGDAAPNVPLVQQVDLKSIHIAEPYMNGAQRLVFTLNLAGGGALPPNSEWYILWYRPNPDAIYSRDYVAMKTDLSGTPSFEFGRINYPLAYTAPETNQGNIPTKVGNADPGSYDPLTGIHVTGYNPTTGTVQITVTRSLLDDDSNVGIGKTFTGIEGRSFLGRNDSLPINQNLTSDFTATGNYVVVGNNSCLQPPAAPTNLTASSPAKGVIALNWTDNSANEDGFLVERSTTIDGSYTQIASVGRNTTSYSNSPVTRRVTYFYRVRAFNGGGQSGYSNIAGARTK